jgi:hypothetical protein
MILDDASEWYSDIMSELSDIKLNRPDLYEPSLFRRDAAQIGRIFLTLGQSIIDSPSSINTAVIIRTKNDREGLTQWLNHIEREREMRDGRIDVLVVDTESQDGTKDRARDFGATLVDITQKEFNYPDSMNRGLEAVQDDVTAAYISVAHAIPILTNGIQAAARHFEVHEDIVGVHGDTDLHENASLGETHYLRIKPGDIEFRDYKEAGLGVLGATNAMIRMSEWHAFPLDTQYAAGGEDTAWAAAALKRNKRIVFDPITSVHHTHGLGPINLRRQFKHWQEVAAGPAVFDQERTLKRRPSLR